MTEFMPYRHVENIVIQELGDEVLIYDLANNNAICLNNTSAVIWGLCDGTRTVSEIARAAAGQLKSDVSEDLVLLALAQLKKKNLVSDESDFQNKFEGSTRREIIRKIGFGAMVALPIAASIQAPMSAAAASCIPFLAPCAGPGCCPSSICNNAGICACMCSAPGDCSSQTGCQSTVNCNLAMVCAP